MRCSTGRGTSLNAKHDDQTSVEKQKGTKEEPTVSEAGVEVVRNGIIEPSVDHVGEELLVGVGHQRGRRGGMEEGKGEGGKGDINRV